MVYNTGAEGIARVRLMAGNLLPEDYPDTDIEFNISVGYSEVCIISHRALNDPFPDTAPEKLFCQGLEQKIAAMLCLKAYGPEFDIKIKELRAEIDRDEAVFGLHVVTETAEETAEAEALMTHTAAKSAGLNCAVPYPNRMKRCSRCGSIECQCYGTRAYDHCV